MTDKLHCPFCGAELEKEQGSERWWYCVNAKCVHKYTTTHETIWQALIQSQKDLEIARKALEEISSHYQDEMGKPTFVIWYFPAKKMCDCADKALETIGKHNE